MPRPLLIAFAFARPIFRIFRFANLAIATQPEVAANGRATETLSLSKRGEVFGDFALDNPQATVMPKVVMTFGCGIPHALRSLD